jgi:hypothetical protein
VKTIIHVGGSVQTELESIIGGRVIVQGLTPVAPVAGPGGFIQAGQGQHVDWIPHNKIAAEIEFRALVVNSNAQLGVRPVIRYSLEVAHGEYNWSEPLAFPAFTGVLAYKPGYIIPGRGISIRVPNRTLRIWFWIEGVLGNVNGGAPYTPVPWVPTLYPAGTPDPSPTATPQVEIVFSFEPVLGAYRPVYPTQDFLPGYAAPTKGSFQQFPITANEFRIRDHKGLAFAPAADLITYMGINGFAGASVDAATLADWSPIPWYALLWRTAPSAAQVDYR